MTFDLAVRLFLRSRQNGTDGAKGEARPYTLRNYKLDVGHFISFMASRDITTYEALTRLDVLDFVEHINQKEWSLATRMKVFRGMRTFFRWVERDEDCRDEKLKSWQKALPAIKKAKPREFIPTPAQLKKFRAAFKINHRSDLRDYVAFCLMLDSGMRVGEVRYLKLDHLHLDQNLIIVPHQGKSGSRPVRITDDLARLLRRWLRKREEFAQCDYVFVTQTGTQLQPFTITQSFIKLRHKHGLAHITPHTLRHAFCTYYLRGGGDIAKLRSLTGHSSYDILEGYLHLAKVGGNQIQEELEKVSPLKLLAGKDENA